MTDNQQNWDDLIILTGGSGFIGSCVLRHLNDLNIHNIIVIDELGNSIKWKNLVGKNCLEIISKQQTFSWLEGKESLIKGFIHLGACSSTVETNASYLLENNYRFSIKLAEYALKNNLIFLYASSAATYGDGTKGFRDEENELETLEPLNMYGFSKHLFDLWVKNQGVLDQVVGLKYFNVFGPNEAHKGRMASAITHVLPTAKTEGVIRLFKSSDPDNFIDGGQARDFIYVKDVARMTCALFEKNPGGIYNIASGHASTWNELAEAIFKALNKPIHIEYIDMPPDLMGKYQNYTCAQMDKTRSILGPLADCIPLEEAVKDYIQNYLLPGKRW